MPNLGLNYFLFAVVSHSVTWTSQDFKPLRGKHASEGTLCLTLWPRRVPSPVG